MPMRLSLDNRAVRALPIDAELRNATRQVANACFSQVTPTPVENPTLVAMSASALATIGLRGDEPDLVNIMSGCQLLEGSTPVAHCYAGHQFGSFAGQLGDGAAILLGEVVGPTGHIELQLKGAGPTPYSRSADGRKVLRSSLREFLCSEAMHGLGIPTTRAATLITSDTRVERDPLYSGASLMERCTVVSRLCPTFIRFGSFEVVLLEGHASDRHGPSPGNSALSQQLFDFVATTYFGAAPNNVAAHRRDEVKRVLAEITKRTAELVAHWQSVGWVHGVLNTDNMSIIGVTIDYGPFAFQEHFDPLLVSNTSDTSGKYAYAHQPDICEWNLLRLGEAFAYVVEAEEERNAFAEELKKQVRDQFKTHFSNALDQLYRSKLGLPVERTSDVPKWRDAFLDVLADTRADFTKSFHILEFFVQGKLPTAADAAAVAVTLSATKEQSVNALKRLAWKSRPNVSPQQAEKLLQEAEESPDRIEMMFGVPADQFKEHMRQQLRQAAKLTELRATIAKMEALQEDALNAQREERWKAFFDAYHQDILAATSAEERESRVAIMRQSNPRFVLRPWVAQLAIEAAEKGDFSVTQRLVDRLLTPYAESPLDDELFQVPPPNYTELCVSCSS